MKILRQNGIDMGQKRLFIWLRENGFLIKRKGSDWNMPTQKSMELGLFERLKNLYILMETDAISLPKPQDHRKGAAVFY